MIILSQNLTNYGVPIPDDSIYRINLAWTNSLDELKNLLEKHKNQKIFVDLPINRTKPPNNKYTLEDLIPIFNTYTNVKYLAISNVNSKSHLDPYLESVSKSITLVPKIESSDGISNIKEITDALTFDEKVVMLDHDDLYSSLARSNEPASNFKNYINTLIQFCNENNVTLLRTIGVIFSDSEKRTTQYMK